MGSIELNLNIDEKYFPELTALPWNLSLPEWKNTEVKIFKAPKGLSRHPVEFITLNNYHFAVKETTPKAAKREFQIYQRLHELGISSLHPVGWVVRNDSMIFSPTPAGPQAEQMGTAWLITQLEEKTLPESHLFRKDFSRKNRDLLIRIIARLLARLHDSGIYWGDASLANLLIKFERENIPKLGRRRTLRAIMADAETVEIKSDLSPFLQKRDLEDFCESIDWYRKDLENYGKLIPESRSEEMKAEIYRLYAIYRDTFTRIKSFKIKTGLSLEKLMGFPENPAHVDILLDHIKEHKWYLNENQTKEKPWKESANHWYENIFLPICAEFRAENIPEHFPGKTAADLYVEIMTNKYYLAQKAGHDISQEEAIRDYAHKFGVEHSISLRIRKIINRFLQILEKENS